VVQRRRSYGQSVCSVLRRIGQVGLLLVGHAFFFAAPEPVHALVERIRVRHLLGVGLVARFNPMAALVSDDFVVRAPEAVLQQ